MPKFLAMPTLAARALRDGNPDALGNPAQHQISDGNGNPCRHCLQDIPEGAGMLVCSYKPFEGTHAYTEIGPVFLCAEDCPQGSDTTHPPILETSPDYLLKGYCAEERIVYGTGQITPSKDIIKTAARIFDDKRVAFIHIRSARNNCYQMRLNRDD